MISAQHYRERAAHAWKLAAATADPVLRSQIEIFAREYETIASSMEQKLKDEAAPKKSPA
jgi:hypothetical protein